VKGLALT
jgi:ER membrane protein complex subunit 1, C-terminal